MTKFTIQTVLQTFSFEGVLCVAKRAPAVSADVVSADFYIGSGEAALRENTCNCRLRITAEQHEVVGVFGVLDDGDHDVHDNEDAYDDEHDEEDRS